MKTDDEPCKGFLIYCDKNREKQAVKDAYNFLTEVFDYLSFSTLKKSIVMLLRNRFIRKSNKMENRSLLKRRQPTTKKSNNRLLTQIKCQCIITFIKCICFIKINPIFKQIDPLIVVSKIMKDVHQQGRYITRYCHRILPVERAFRAEHFRMLVQLDELMSIHSQSK